jgi:hypothetical protein
MAWEPATCRFGTRAWEDEMFERGRSDQAPAPSAVPVEAVFVDGTVAKGKMYVPAGRGLAELLNGAGDFVEFEPYGGERRFISKSQLAMVQPVGVPRAPSLQARLADMDGFEPHRVLGLRAGASREEVRSAYFALAKVYHPDRYVSADLPAEVGDYLASMARRVNAAYDALDVTQRREAMRAEPVFTSAAR